MELGVQEVLATEKVLPEREGRDNKAKVQQGEKDKRGVGAVALRGKKADGAGVDR